MKTLRAAAIGALAVIGGLIVTFSAVALLVTSFPQLGAP